MVNTSSSNGRGKGQPVVDKKKKIGVLGMLVVGFFWVYGGPYGTEPLIRSAPSHILLILLIVMPFFYSLPISLITAELSVAFPRDGGLVVWVQDACGSVIGGHNTYWMWLGELIDASVYPSIASDYIGTIFGLTPFQRSILADFIVIILTAVNLAGLESLLKWETVFAAVSLLPCIAYIILGAPLLDFKSVNTETGPVDIPLLVGWVMWLYCGFLNLGTLAGEVKNPQRTFTYTIMILLPLVVCMNYAMVAVALSQDPIPSNYIAGHFNVLAGQLAGSWLRYSFFIGSLFSLLGMYNGLMVNTHCFFSFLIESKCSRFLTAISRYSNTLGDSYPSQLFQYLVNTGPADTMRPINIVFNAICVMILQWMPSTVMVEVAIMLFSLPTILFLYSFLRLRLTRPDVPRPFAIPGQMWFVTAVTAVPMMISAFCLIIMISASQEKLVGLLIVISLGIVCQLVSNSSIFNKISNSFTYMRIPLSINDSAAHITKEDDSL